MSDFVPRALRLLLGLLVAGVTVPMGVASLSEEACSRTAGSGNINSCGICEALTNDLRLVRANLKNKTYYLEYTCYYKIVRGVIGKKKTD